MGAGFVKLSTDCSCGNGLQDELSSAVTFAAVLLRFTDTILFNVWRSRTLSFGF